MNSFKRAILAGLALAGATLPAQAAYRVIYKVSGVVSVQVGIATAIHCTNLNSVTQKVRVAIYDYDGRQAAVQAFGVGAGKTATFVTQPTVLYAANRNLNTGNIQQGHAVISAELDQMICSVVLLDSANAVPKFASDLHMVKFPQGGGGEE